MAATLPALLATTSLAGERPRFRRCPPPGVACIVAIGDSTMQGRTYFAPHLISPADAMRTLQAILKLQPRGYLVRLGKDLRRAQILNLAVSGTSSADWGVGPRQRVCDEPQPDGEEIRLPGLELLRRSCAEGGGMAAQIVAQAGRVPDIVLVTLGTNDTGTVVESVLNLLRISNQLTPAKVLFSSPFYSTVAVRQAWHDELTAGLQGLNLLKGPNFGLYPFPTVDGVHLSEPGYAAAAGLWLGALRALPPQ